MAACGLEISRRNSTHGHDISDLESKYNVVHVMVQFAAEMMAILENLKVQSTKPYKYNIIYYIFKIIFLKNITIISYIKNNVKILSHHYKILNRSIF
jgi:glucose-6-phosphate isomerase